MGEQLLALGVILLVFGGWFVVGFLAGRSYEKKFHEEEDNNGKA